jgi:hypothetical protein
MADMRRDGFSLPFQPKVSAVYQRFTSKEEGVVQNIIQVRPTVPVTISCAQNLFGLQCVHNATREVVPSCISAHFYAKALIA